MNPRGTKAQAYDNMVDAWRDDAFSWARHSGPKLIVILVVAFILVRLLALISRRLRNYQHAEALPSGMRAQQLRTMADVINSVGNFVIYLVALLQLLPLFGVDVKPILASAGIAGLAVGFGAQTLVKDMINGFFIILENQFDVSDVVKIAGVTGTVENMTLRRTMLRDSNGTVHIIPNSEIKVVSNLTRDWTQVTLNVSVDYNENSDRILKLLNQIGEEIYHDENFMDYFVAEPEVPGIDRISGREVEYLMEAKVKPGRQYEVGRELRRRIQKTFAEQGVQTPAAGRVFIADNTTMPGGKTGGS
jgi:moderate conductance mechanosensitive channel